MIQTRSKCFKPLSYFFIPGSRMKVVLTGALIKIFMHQNAIRLVNITYLEKINQNSISYKHTAFVKIVTFHADKVG